MIAESCVQSWLVVVIQNPRTIEAAQYMLCAYCVLLNQFAANMHCLSKL